MRLRGWIWIAVCVALAARAPGSAAPAVSPSGSPPGSSSGSQGVPASDALSSQQIASVAALARAAALVRYLHPSDQAAALDWDAFLPAAIDRVLGASGPDPAALLAELRAVFAPVAPTAVFSMAGDPPTLLPPARGATHLARWRRYGLQGTSPYPSFREGREREANVAVSEVITAPLAHPERCRAARVNAVIRRTVEGTVDLVLRALGPGQNEKLVVWPVSATYSHVVFPSEVPPDTQEIVLGVQVDGRASATLESLTLTCEGDARIKIDPGAPGWRRVGPADLHTWRTARCGTGRCATLARNPRDRAFVAERDLLATDLGSGIRLDLPLAVWANAARTLPAVADPPRAAPPSDPRAHRLASVAAAWGAVAVFYPHFQDQRIDWDAALDPALAEAAAAWDAAELRIALRHLLAELHDGHARLLDSATSPGGVLPIAVRRFGDLIAFTGAANDVSGIAPGSELVAIDGIPARVAYDRAADQVSAATDGLRAHFAAISLGAGAQDGWRHVLLRTPDGTDFERELRLVPRERHDRAVRMSRPWPSTELIPGVFYVDFDDLDPATWAAELPYLATARALIFDFRGYSTTGVAAVSHLIAHRIDQLTWQLPELPHLGRASYTPVRRGLYPSSPRLTAPVVALVDGQSSSIVEITLAMIREHHLGLLVGEPTAGTCGLISERVPIPGGYKIQFTAVRLTDAAGATLYGRGIAPDIVVHPTLDGVRAGRDEIREAGLAAALRLAAGAPVTP